MIRVPVPGESSGHYHLVYDAWNRLVAVYKADGTTIVADYEYRCPCQLRVADFFAEGLRWPGTEKRLCWVSRG